MGNPLYSLIMMVEKAGYRENVHMADWELHVWAPDLPALLEQAARGMYALSGTRLRTQPLSKRNISLPAGDPERLLVNFLSELLYIGEQEGLAFDSYRLVLDGEMLLAELDGAAIASQNKEIKAVTYHNLMIRSVEHGLEVDIVFDV